MASFVDTVPIEIITSIFDIVPENSNDPNHALLKSCSLACRGFLPFCCRHNFRTVELAAPQKLNIFARLIKDIPAVADHVWELNYRLPKSGSNFGYSMEVTASFGRLSRLKKLTLWCSGMPYDWSGMNPSMRSILLPLLHLPTISTLHLKAIDSLIPSDLDACLSLTHLHIDKVEILERPCAASSVILPATGFTPLQELEVVGDIVAHSAIRRCNQDISDEMHKFNFGKLRSIYFRHGHAKDYIVEDVLKQARCLEKVRIEGYDLDRIITNQATRSLEMLTVLNLSAGPFSRIIAVLQRLSARSSITNLQLSTHIKIDDDYTWGEEWNSLAAIVLGPGWDSLVQINLNIFVYSSHDFPGRAQIVDLFSNLPNTDLQRLSSHQTLKFNYSLKDWDIK